MDRDKSIESASTDRDEAIKSFLAYIDALPYYHGYKFVPTDSEIIVGYLKRKMESRDVPTRWPIHEVDFYNYTVQELTDKYEAATKNTWYFVSSTELSPSKGRTRNGGWKMTHKHTMEERAVYYRGELVGYKINYELLDDNLQKTEWLLQVYFIEDPNHGNSLSSWVLGKIYKKEDDPEEDDPMEDDSAEEEELEEEEAVSSIEDDQET